MKEDKRKFNWEEGGESENSGRWIVCLSAPPPNRDREEGSLRAPSLP